MTTSTTTRYAGRIATPLGPMIAVVDDNGALTYLDFEDHDGPVPGPENPHWKGGPVVWDDCRVTSVEAAVVDYFDGRRQSFELPVNPEGNEFHRLVWSELCRIPFGETISYGELARRIGRPGAARAVGRANGANPIAVVIPCHRVIGADGKLTGYSGGIERKAALLAHERAKTPAGQETLPLGVAPGPVRRVK